MTRPVGVPSQRFVRAGPDAQHRHDRSGRGGAGLAHPQRQELPAVAGIPRCGAPPSTQPDDPAATGRCGGPAGLSDGSSAGRNGRGPTWLSPRHPVGPHPASRPPTTGGSPLWRRPRPAPLDDRPLRIVKLPARRRASPRPPVSPRGSRPPAGRRSDIPSSDVLRADLALSLDLSDPVGRPSTPPPAWWGYWPSSTPPTGGRRVLGVCSLPRQPGCALVPDVVPVDGLGSEGPRSRPTGAGGAPSE